MTVEVINSPTQYTLDVSRPTSMVIEPVAGVLSVPQGGTAGQYLIKNSDSNYDFSWANPTVNLTSIYTYANSIYAHANTKVSANGGNINGNLFVSGSVRMATNGSYGNYLQFDRVTTNQWKLTSDGVGDIVSIVDNSVTIPQDVKITRGGLNVAPTTGCTALRIVGGWNDANTNFSIINVAVSDTASVSTSRLVDLKINNEDVFYVNKSGGFGIPQFEIRPSTSLYGAFLFSDAERVRIGSSFVELNSGGMFRWSSTGNPGSPATYLYSDSANVIAQRNGTAPQTFRVYGDYTDASNYERLSLRANSTAHYIKGEASGTGVGRPLYIGANNLNAITVTNVGYVGISNTSPEEALHVTGYIRGTLKAPVGTFYYLVNGDPNSAIFSNTGIGWIVQQYSSVRLRIRDSQNTANYTDISQHQVLAKKYELQDSSNAAFTGWEGGAGTAGKDIILRGGNSGVAPQFSGGHAGNVIIHTGIQTSNTQGREGNRGTIKFSTYTSGNTPTLTERMSIDDDVKIGITGFTSPLSGSLRVMSDNSNYGQLGFSNRYNNFVSGFRSYGYGLYARDLRIYVRDFSASADDGNEVARFDANGFVGFGITSPTANLAMANGINSATMHIYHTYTDASNYERLAFTGNTIKQELAGTGDYKDFIIQGGGNVKALRLYSPGNGKVIAETDGNQSIDLLPDTGFVLVHRKPASTANALTTLLNIQANGSSQIVFYDIVHGSSNHTSRLVSVGSYTQSFEFGAPGAVSFGSGTNIRIYAGQPSSSTGHGGNVYIYAGESGGSGANGHIILQHNGVSSRNGSVGIGVTAPGAQLHLVSNKANTHPEKIFRIDANTGRRIATIAGDGRFYVGSDNGYNVVFSVDTNGEKRDASYAMLIRDTNELFFASNGMVSSNPNFNFGANNFGATIEMVSPAQNGLLRINKANTTIGQGNQAGAPNKTLRVYTALPNTQTTVRIQESDYQGTTEVFGVYANNDTTARLVVTNANVGIGTASPSYKLEVAGSFAAQTKSFIIEHQSKPGYKLRHGSLEGPENGVYVRGRSFSNTIELPEYWKWLVNEETITVNLTAIAATRLLSVEKIANNKVHVITDGEYFYTVTGERKDVADLIVEVPG